MAEKYNKPQNIRDLAARLSALGYFPVPIPAGCKGPTIAGWDKLRLTPEDCQTYFPEKGALVGVLHVNLLALDIDVYDPDLSRIIVTEAMRRFPGALERVGQAPKSALFFRMDEPGFKLQNSEKHEKDGLSAQVEVRSVSRQIVAYGVHPTTGRPYTWPRGELWATPRNSLPLADRASIEQFRDWCNDQIRKWAGVADHKIIDLGLYPRGMTDERATPEAFREALSYVPPSAQYDEWVDALMAIHDFYNGSAEGLGVAKDWSSPHPNYTPREVETKWRSFEVGKGTTYRTVFHLAKMNGANLSEIARKHKATPDKALALHAEADFVAIGQATPEQPKTNGLEWFKDIEAALTDSYLVKGFLAQGAMSVIYGPSNSGKTFFALDLAYALACGTPWRGLRVKQTAVLYLAAEGGRGVQNRLAALKVEHGAIDIPLSLRRAGMDLLRAEADLQAVYDLARTVQAECNDLPLVIVIDTLSRVMAGGDENSAADMTALIRNIDAIRERTGAHIMLVHHTGKDAARGARGHSSLRAATDTEIEVQATEDDEGQLVRAAMVTKQRDYQGGETFAFALKGVTLGVDQDGDEVTSCVVIDADADDFNNAKKAKKGLGGNQKLIADTFDQMLGEGMGKPNPGGVGFPDPGRFWCVSTDDLRRHAQAKMVGTDTGKLFRQAWASLTDKRGLFCTADNLVWRTDRKVR